MENNFKYDILRMYFKEDYKVCDGIIIRQPSIGEIIDYGESSFWSMVTTLCANPTMMRLDLWHNGIDWNTLTDFELFIMLSSSLTVERTKVLFGDLDFTKFKTISVKDEEKEENENGGSDNSENKEENKEKFIMIYMPNPTIQIDEELYNNIVGYIRLMFNIFPKTEKAKGQATKESIILEEETNLRISLRKKKESKHQSSTLFPMVSAALNHPGFKYKRSELKDVGIVEFMDCIKRLQIFESTTALMTGMYMGMIDLKGMDLSKELNWARDLYDD